MLVKQPFKFSKWFGIFLLIFVLLFSGVIVGQFVNLGVAQPYPTTLPYPTVTILSDGRVEGTDLIQRDGNVYTFLGDIFGTLKVEKDGVIIDGAGYAIRADWYGGVMLKKNPADMVMPPSYGEVVVRNVRFCNRSHIFASTQGNSFLNNTFEGGGIEIRGGINGTENIIKHNVFIDSGAAISADYSGRTVVIENNFINYSLFIGIYGLAVRLDGNYWSDYETLYPEAKEIGHTGIWDTPYKRYALDRPGWSDSLVDFNPLVNPIVGAGAPEINAVPTLLPTLSTVDEEPISLLTVLIVASVVFVVIVSICLRVYLKSHKHFSRHHLV